MLPHPPTVVPVLAVLVVQLYCCSMYWLLYCCTVVFSVQHRVYLTFDIYSTRVSRFLS